jgi:hypothetical protein
MGMESRVACTRAAHDSFADAISVPAVSEKRELSMNFFVVLLVDGREWGRANIMVGGEPQIADVAHRLFTEWRAAHPTEQGFDRLTMRIDKEPAQR